MAGIVLATSGYKHRKDQETRSEDIEMSRSFTIFLGAAELAGGLGVISGVLAQLAGIASVLLMLGAIRKKYSFGIRASRANQGRMVRARTRCLSQ
jgi:putative oxidoreductase